MRRSQNGSGFAISVSGRDDGTVEAAYIRFGADEVAATKEIVRDILLADYDAQGNLIGIEILAPVSIAQLVELVEQDRRDPFRRFVQHSMPKDLLAA